MGQTIYNLLNFVIFFGRPIRSPCCYPPLVDPLAGDNMVLQLHKMVCNAASCARQIGGWS